MDIITKKIAVSSQEFETISKEYLYVDKTSYIAKMFTGTDDVLFLSRPRRFGKSVTVSTLEALFNGRQDLFEGLDIKPRLEENLFAPRPVIRLDMSKAATANGLEEFRKSLRGNTFELAKAAGVMVREDAAPSNMLDTLIMGLHQASGKKVAVLVDEYDKPYLEFMDRFPGELDAMRNNLKDYYTILKANDKYISFIYITGISKFSGMGLFSGFNNINDISLDPEFASICGYTKEEVLKYFGAHLKVAAEKFNVSEEELFERLVDYYDGFCFDGNTKVFNPFSTAKFFSKCNFRNFWFSTGTSSVLAQYMKKNHLTVHQFRGLPISEDFAWEPGGLDITPPHGFLYQAGYLSLRPGVGSYEFTLDYPNAEVYQSMSRLMMINVLESEVTADNTRSQLLEALSQPSPDLAILLFNLVYSKLPYDDYSIARVDPLNQLYQKIYIKDSDHIANEPKNYSEFFYRAILYSSFIFAGLNPRAEEHSSRGRSDLVVEHGGWTWIIELKMAEQTGQIEEKLESAAENALGQIVEKGYADPYRNRDHVLLGIAIDGERRRIGAWRFEIKPAPIPPV